MTKLSSSTLNHILDLACQLQQIASPTFHENKKAVFVERQLQQAGLQDVHIDSIGNVLGRLPGGSASPLVMSAHMDTVHPHTVPLTLKRCEDRIFGPSIGDNSLGLASLISLPNLLREAEVNPPGDIWLVGNVCEEGLGDLRGMRALVGHFGKQPVAYLILEGMGLGQIYHRGLGVERYRITARTAGGHSWVDFGKPSAIHALAGLIHRLAALKIPARPRTSFNVGVIQGGTSVNTIAPEAWAEVDLRSESSASLRSLSAQVRTLTSAAASDGVTFEVEIIGQRPAGEISEDHPLVRLAKNSLAAEGVQPHLEIASTDANIPLAEGLPAICVGITNGARAHTTSEYIDVEPIHAGAGQVIRLVSNIWKSLA